MNLVETVGAFILAFGILLTFINFFKSRRSGAVAGNNPWRADSLEWSTSSPPPPYGSIHIPTVCSRNPLWDEHQEEYDPEGERILDQGRLTLSTDALDAYPASITRMAEDSIVPLFLALSITAVLVALLFTKLWLGVGFAFLSVAIEAIWIWPRHAEPEP